MISIKQNKTGVVRDKLCMEDVHIEHLRVAIGCGLVKLEYDHPDGVLILKDPIKVPTFNKFYASRINSVSDPYLLDVCRRLVYLNPEPDTLLKKKITEYILMRFSKMEMVESSVKEDEYLPKPVLSFEEVFAVVVQAVVLQLTNPYEPLNEVTVLFPRESKISRTDKISISKKYRSARVFEMMESSIHTVAEILMDEADMLTITNSRIKSTELVKVNTKAASLNTIKKYMSQRTKAAIEDYNEAAPFRSLKTKENYERFITLKENMSLHEYVNILGVSKSTIVEFKRIKNNF